MSEEICNKHLLLCESDVMIEYVLLIQMVKDGNNRIGNKNLALDESDAIWFSMCLYCWL